MKTRKDNHVERLKRLWEKENEELMLAVYRLELQEMQRLAEYGY